MSPTADQLYYAWPHEADLDATETADSAYGYASVLNASTFVYRRKYDELRAALFAVERQDTCRAAVHVIPLSVASIDLREPEDGMQALVELDYTDDELVLSLMMAAWEIRV